MLCDLLVIFPASSIEEKMNPISSLSDKLLQQVQFALLTSCQFFKTKCGMEHGAVHPTL